MADLQCEFSASGEIPVNVVASTSFGVGLLLVFGFVTMASLLLFDGKGRSCFVRSVSFLSDKLAVRLDLPYHELLLLVVYATATLFPVASAAIQSGKLQNVAKTLGTITQLNLAVVILPATRTSLWTTLFGLPYDRAVVYHRWLAWYAVAAMWAHFLCYLIAAGTCILNYSIGENPPLYGLAAVALFTAASVCALEPIRRKYFELFRASHLAYIVAFVLVILHSTSMAMYLAIPVGLYLLDWVMRLRRWGQQWAIQSVSTTGPITVLTLLPPPAFTFEAGQYCFVQVPIVSRNQWHPFSIASAPSDRHGEEGRLNITFAIKSAGKHTWTGNLNAMIETWNGYGNLDVRVDGPVGGLGCDIPDYKRVVLIAGGIGATPLLSILNDLRCTNKKDGESDVVDVVFVWVVRDVSECVWATPMLCSPEKLRGHHHVKSSVKVFVTGEVDAEKAATLPVPVSHGRPNLASMFEALAARALLNDAPTNSSSPRHQLESKNSIVITPHDTIVVACGPQPLVASAHREAIASGFAFKSESFLF